MFSFAVGFTGALSPGPLMARVMQRARSAGTRAGLFLTLGHGAVELVFSLLLIWGLKEVVGEDSVLITIVAFAGAAVLGLMGVSSIRAVLSGRLDTELEGMVEGEAPAPSRKDIAGLFASGMLLSVVNPYWVIWWLTVGAGYLLAMGRDWPSYWVFFGAHVSADAVVYVPLAFLVSRGLGGWLKGRWYSRLEMACGVFFVAFAVMFAAYGAKRILG